MKLVTHTEPTEPSSIPSYAAWFSFSKVHDIEKRFISEFFTGRSATKTPKIYVQFRDFMIRAYRKHPKIYLSFTAVRKNLAGDVN